MLPNSTATLFIWLQRTKFEIFPHDELGGRRAHAQLGQVGRRDAERVHVGRQVTASLPRTRHHIVTWAQTGNHDPTATHSQIAQVATHTLAPNVGYKIKAYLRENVKIFKSLFRNSYIVKRLNVIIHSHLCFLFLRVDRFNWERI